MNLLTLSWNNLKAKPLSTGLSLLLLTLGVAMIGMLLQISRETQAQLERNLAGIDMVVGAKGSPLQLVLANVYHIDNPTGNIPLSEAKELTKHRLVKLAAPLSYGDNLKGFRILGSTEKLAELYGSPKVAEGRWWSSSLEITLGAKVAAATELKVGDHVHGSHGSAEEGHVHDEHHYEIVGILEPQGSVLDQLALTSLESVWDVHDDHEPDSNRAITAMLFQFRNPMGVFQLPRLVNSSTSMQAALPGMEINRLINLMGFGLSTIRGIGIALMVLAGVSLFITLFQRLRDRRYELALMRVMGAGPWKLFALVLLEGLWLSLAGYAIGMLGGRLAFYFFSLSVSDQTHMSLSLTSVGLEEILLLLPVLGIGLLASLIPARYAYRTNISETLASA